MRRLLLYFFFLLFLSSCKKEKENLDLGYSYFPMEEGSYVMYKVEEIFHDKDAMIKHDTVRYKLKRQIGEEITDNLGRKARKFYLTKYNFDSDEKINMRVWTRYRDEFRGEIIEENQRKIRLTFAVNKNKEWNINAFNTESKETASYQEINEAKTINGYPFEQTVKVFFSDYLTLVDYIKKEEIYAKNVGLVKRSFKNLYINNFDTLNIQKGTEIHYTLLEFGKKDF